MQQHPNPTQNPPTSTDEAPAPSTNQTNQPVSPQPNGGAPAPVSNVADQQLQTQTSTDDEPLPSGWEVTVLSFQYPFMGHIISNHLYKFYHQIFRCDSISLEDVIMLITTHAAREYFKHCSSNATMIFSPDFARIVICIARSINSIEDFVFNRLLM